MLYLTRHDLEHLLAIKEVIDVVREAFVELSTGKPAPCMPVRTALEGLPREGTPLFMPVYSPRLERFAVKVVSVFPRNFDLGLPTINSLILLFDAITGKPLAIMEGSYITALRTGAASAVATDTLARRDAEILSIIGAGVQGRAQLRCIVHVRRISEVRVYDALPGNAERFVEEMTPFLQSAPIKRGAPPVLRSTRTAEEAVEGADIIVTATTSKVPVLEWDWIKPGAHINAIGAFKPDMRELDSKTIANADKVIVDSRAAIMKEAGDLLIPLEEGTITEERIDAELGEVLSGLVRGRDTNGAITVFKTVGVALLDLAVADLVSRKATSSGVGTEVTL
ncbi:MAG TPA: ornithine cyclodeaminase family protein [Clostridia bacterium]|nr:ornithine cyclodeaminase family protein [Clostridia bacterium]